MHVTLIDYTGAGRPDPADYAAGILLFIKDTRLTMSPGQMTETMALPYEEKVRRLEYVAHTIPSSWEFVDYSFLIQDVPRSFTHQLVRKRTASFAQQTMRVLHMQDWGYNTGPTIERDPDLKALYDHQMRVTDNCYNTIIKHGAAIEDARGLLPTDILTNIAMKVNLRSFVEMVRARVSSRVQGVYRDVLEEMIEATIAVHPWIEMFLNRTFDQAAKELDDALQSLPNPQRTNLVKLLDQMRTQYMAWGAE